MKDYMLIRTTADLRVAMLQHTHRMVDITDAKMIDFARWSTACAICMSGPDALTTLLADGIRPINSVDSIQLFLDGMYAGETDTTDEKFELFVNLTLHQLIDVYTYDQPDPELEQELKRLRMEVVEL